MISMKRLCRRILPMVIFIFFVKLVYQDVNSIDKEIQILPPSSILLGQGHGDLSYKRRNSLPKTNPLVRTGELQIPSIPTENRVLEAMNLEAKKTSANAKSEDMNDFLEAQLASVTVGKIRSDKPTHTTTWMRITNDIYTYSGYWDSRKNLTRGPRARILGMWRYEKESLTLKDNFSATGDIKTDHMNISCYLWHNNSDNKIEGKFKAFYYEESMKSFIGVFFFCFPLETMHVTPYAVSLVLRNVTGFPHKLIYLKDVANIQEKNDQELLVPLSEINSTAVCVRPMYGPFDDVISAIQFISFYSIVLKIKHFYFYDMSITKRVRQVLEGVRRADVDVHLLPWNLPTGAWDELWDYGSLTSINDCIYRSMGRHTHIAVVDMDEFMVPKLGGSLGIDQIYKETIVTMRGNVGDGALIRNVFFCNEYNNTKEETTSLPPGLVFKRYNYTHYNELKKAVEEQTVKETKRKDPLSSFIEQFPIFNLTIREPRPWGLTIRSKMILVPETIVSVGHHMVHNFVSKHFLNQGILRSLALLHHYRSCQGIRYGTHATGLLMLDSGDQPEVDRSVVKFKNLFANSKLMKQLTQYLVL